MKDEAIPPHATATDEHPAPETLLAYRNDELSADQDDAVREHLVECADCTGLVLELTTARETEDTHEELSEIDVQRAWRRVRPQLEQKTSPHRAKLQVPWGMLLAASLLLTLVPLIFLYSGNDRNSDDLVRLSALSASRSPRAPEGCTELAAGARTWQLLLPVRDDLASTELRLEILNEERQLVTTQALAAPSADGFYFELHRANMEAGHYLLNLVDEQPHEPLLIERYCVEIIDG